MLIEIDGDEMHFQTLTTGGGTVDKGTLFAREKSASPDLKSEAASEPVSSSQQSEKSKTGER